MFGPSPLTNISTLDILISPPKSLTDHQNGVPKTNPPGIHRGVNPRKPEISRNSRHDFMTLGSPYQGWGEMRLMCWTTLMYGHLLAFPCLRAWGHAGKLGLTSQRLAKTNNQHALLRDSPSTAGNCMRPSPEPLLKKEASPAVLGGRKFWKCSGSLKCFEL